MSTDWKSRAIDPKAIRESPSDGNWRSRAIDIKNSASITKEQSEESEDKVGKSVKEAIPQFIKEAAISTLGTYGDLLGLIGIKENEEKRRKKSEKEFEILERMEKPGYKPSFADIYNLTDDAYEPEAAYPPTTKGLRDITEAIGGPGEPETFAGKAAARSGGFYGAGLSFGQINPIPALAAGTAGEAAESIGAGPLIQAGVEIASLLFTGRKPTGKISSSKTVVKNKIEELRNLGYTEQDIALAVNSGKTKIANWASKGKKTESAFQDFSKNSDRIVDDILTSEVPGLKTGTRKVHEMASDAYGEMVKEAAKIKIKNAQPFEDSIKRVSEHLENTLGTNPEAAAFMKRLESAKESALKNPTAEPMVNFYKELGRMGKWTGRKEKDRIITEVRNGIKDTFKAQGKEGEQLLNKFEQVNQGVKKAYDAEDLVDLLSKSRSPEGTNYKKLNKALEDPENQQLLKDVLGDTQAKNIKLISKTGAEIKDFDKAWKRSNWKLARYGTEAAFQYSFWHSIVNGDFDTAAKVAAVYAGRTAGRKILEKSLRDPKYQNILIKGAHAIKNENPKLLKSVNDAITKYHQEEFD